MSRHAEVTRYYPECRKIKRIRKQWIPGPLPDFSNGPGDELWLHPLSGIDKPGQSLISHFLETDSVLVC